MAQRTPIDVRKDVLIGQEPLFTGIRVDRDGTAHVSIITLEYVVQRRQTLEDIASRAVNRMGGFGKKIDAATDALVLAGTEIATLNAEKEALQAELDRERRAHAETRSIISSAVRIDAARRKIRPSRTSRRTR